MTTMPFGKFQGLELTEVPKWYLSWLRDRDWLGGWLAQAIDEVLVSEPGEPKSEALRQEGEYRCCVAHKIVDGTGRDVAYFTDERLARIAMKALQENAKADGKLPYAAAGH